MSGVPPDSLPIFDELFAPDFGADIPGLSRELFARDLPGLMRLEDGSVVVYGNAELNAVLPNQAFGNVPAEVLSEDPDFFRLLHNHVFTMNPPMHGPHRKVFSKPFTAAAVKTLVETGEQVVAEVVAEAIERQAVEFSADVAVQITSRFWGRLLGMTPEEVQIVAEVIAGDFALNFLLDRREEQTEASRRANRVYLDTVRAAVLRSLQRGDNELISTMAADLEAIEIDDRVEDVGLLLGASLGDGFHTLGMALANIGYSLVTRPEALERVRDDPGLVTGAFNEGIRVDPPLISTFRYTIAETELGGVLIPEETLVFLIWMIGNRDPKVFDRPDEYMLTRDSGLARPFGGGIHNCPGRNVSRMLGDALVRRITAPGIRVEPTGEGEPKWVTGSIAHELEGGFPVTFRAA